MPIHTIMERKEIMERQMVKTYGKPAVRGSRRFCPWTSLRILRQYLVINKRLRFHASRRDDIEFRITWIEKSRETVKSSGVARNIDADFLERCRIEAAHDPGQLASRRGEGHVRGSLLADGGVHQSAVGKPTAVARSIGQHDLDGNVLAPGFGAVDLDGEGIEEHLRSELGDHIVRGRLCGGAEVARAQLGGPRNEEASPSAVLGSVSELFVGVREKTCSGCVIGLGKDRVVEDLGCPTEIALVECSLTLLDDLVKTPSEIDVAFGPLHRYVLP